MSYSINSPRTINTKDLNGDGSVDFLSNYVKFNNIEDIPIIANIYMTNDYLCRFDLICQRFYGSTDELDLLLQFNGIDDMFAIPIGTQILVPDKYALTASAEFISTNTQYSLDRNNKATIFSNIEPTQTTESVLNSRTSLQDRGASYELVAPGVIKF